MDPGISPQEAFQIELPICKLDISNPQIPRQDPQKFSKHAAEASRSILGANLRRNKLGIVRHKNGKCLTRKRGKYASCFFVGGSDIGFIR